MENDILIPVNLLSSTRIGAVVTVQGDDGLEYRGRVLRVDGDRALVRTFEKLDFQTESPLRLTLVQALPNREKMAFIIQKAVELGVSSIIPCHSAKSASVAVPAKGQDKSHRWPIIAQRAVEQCRRRTLPNISPVGDLAQVVRSLRNEDALKMVLYERESATRLSDLALTVTDVRHAIVICGPEGGFAEEEVVHAQRSGFMPIRLGGRVLRCETAALAAVAIIQHVWGDL
jgi:16S rRNA (uracil1498-N3)-methyltransferase